MTRTRCSRNTASGSAQGCDEKNGAHIDTATFSAATMQRWSLVSLRKRAGHGRSLGRLGGETKVAHVTHYLAPCIRTELVLILRKIR